MTLRDEVRTRYAAAALAVTSGSSTACCGADSADGAPGAGEAGCCGGPADTGCGSGGFGADLYPAGERTGLPAAAVQASLGCGNPLLVAELRDGETVLDLGSGGGIDVLLSARRVGPTGRAYGLNMTDEMLDLAWRNAAEAGM